MEGPLYLHLIIEEVKLPSLDLSSMKLHLIIDSITKEYQYPYRDIYFQVSNKYTFPAIKLVFFGPKFTAEGIYHLKGLKYNENIRLQLQSNKETLGHTQIRLAILEHLNKEICRHCSLATEILNYNSKSAKKLSGFENRIIFHNLGLEISLKDLEKKEILNYDDFNYLKHLLLGAHEKIKALELNQSNRSYSNFHPQDSVRTTVIDYPKIIATLEQEISNQNKTIDSIHNENKSYLELNKKERAKNKTIFEELEALKLENNVLKGEMIKIRANRRKTACAESTMEDLLNCKKEAEAELRKLRELYEKSINDFARANKGYEDTISHLTEEKDHLQKFKEKIMHQLKELSNERDKLFSLTLSLKSEIYEKEAKIKVLESMNKESMAEELIKENVANLYQKIEGDLKRFNDFSRLMRKEKCDSMQKLTQQLDDAKETKLKIESLESSLRQSQVKGDDSLVKLSIMKQKIYASKIDLEVSNDMKEIKSQALELEATTSKQLDFLIKFILDLSQKFLFQQRLITKIFKFIQDKDSEICILRHKIMDQQGTVSIYIPEKADNIDMSMADYINTRPSFLEIPFIRIEQGVYLFGSKIVKVKLQNNRLIMCMGGGFMSIDEFISIFTPQELDKLSERKKYDLAAEMKALVSESLSYIGSDEAKSPTEPVKRKLRPELSVNLNTSRDSSRGSISSPLAFQHNRRSLTRKGSLVGK